MYTPRLVAITRFRTFSRIALLFLASGALVSLHSQSFSNGYVYGGATFGKHLDGAGRFGAGFNFTASRQVDLGVEVGTIHKHDVGILGSGNLSYHVNRSHPSEEWDPFLVAGVTAARISGVSGLYVNLGGGVNYWMIRRWGLRGEFKGYPGGQDLGGFAELRFGIVFH
jgi:hypothetical protein